MADELNDVIVTVRDAQKREIDVRLVPWNKTISTRGGAEEFAPGSFDDIPDTSLYLMEMEHGASIGLGQDGQPTLKRSPHGRSTKVWSGDDGGYATFRVAKTSKGDDMLALAEDGIVTGVSVEMDPTRNVADIITRAGKKVRRITRALGVNAAALTYRPAYGDQATVIAIRSQEVPMPETQEAPAAGLSQEDRNALVAAMSEVFTRSQDELQARLVVLEEESRKAVSIPATRTEDKAIPDKGEWMSVVLQMLAGDVISPQVMRTIDDVITTDNMGVVPPAYLGELLGVIDASRPFLSTTRRLPLPPSGKTITVPVITQRPEVGVQATEKTEVASQKTIITDETFTMKSIAGAADISIQLIKRSDPPYLSLFFELLAEQYAIVSEDVALDTLANAAGGWGTGNALNPASLSLGAAFVTSFDAIRRPPDTIWLSTQAVGEFIDAKATGTNAPLYSDIRTSATAAGGITGTISGLRVVHVPTLDDHGAFALVGPSSGFAWTEDGTYQLSADIPTRAGRDVGIIGMLFSMPLYPDAFSLYNVAS